MKYCYPLGVGRNQDVEIRIHQKLEFTRKLEQEQKLNQTNSKFCISNSQTQTERKAFTRKKSSLNVPLSWFYSVILRRFSVSSTFPLFLPCPFFSQYLLPGATQITSSIFFGNSLQEIEVAHNKVLSQILLKGF